MDEKRNPGNETKTLEKAEKAYLSRARALPGQSASFATLKSTLRNAGKTKLSQKQRKEIKAYDDAFIVALEDGFSAIDSIILNPRSFIRELPELVDAGRAKKINSQSVSHLASHTQYVYEVKDNGDVTPMKILTVNSEVDFQIYENRFVWSLINKAALFIEKRYQYIKEHGETFDSEVLILHNETEIGGARYEVDTRVKMSTPSLDEGNADHNKELLVRLSRLRERASYYRKSSFAEAMVGAKPVSNPIHMTNMIVKEPHYHACYELWNFLDSYTELGVHFDIQETEQEFTEQDFDDFYTLLSSEVCSLHSTLIEKRELKEPRVKEKSLEPKVVFSLEDETFEDGKYLYEQFPDGLPSREQMVASSYSDSFPTFEAAKAERLALEERFRDYAGKKNLTDMAIEEAKAREVAEIAMERKKKAEEEKRLREEAEAKAKADAERKQKAIQKALDAIAASQKAMEEERLRRARKAARIKALMDAGYDPYAYVRTAEQKASLDAEVGPLLTPVEDVEMQEEEGPYLMPGDKKRIVRRIYKTRDGRILTKRELEEFLKRKGEQE